MLDFLSFSIAEWAGLISGVCYILCAHKKTNYSWIFGIVSAACIVFVDITKTHLYFDAILHCFFLMMSVIGMYLWYQGAEAKKKIRISRMSITSYIGYLFISLLISGAAGFLFQEQTDAVLPYLDCFQMMLSIFATFLVIYCVINAWSYWILVDVISISIYIYVGAYLFAVLYIGYLISNGLKWMEWSKMYKSQKPRIRRTSVTP